MPVPYSEHVGDRDPVVLMASTLDGYRTTLANVSNAEWRHPWQPGKWSLREIMVHVAQWEMIFGYRLACGVSMPGFSIQAADQDALMTRTAGIDGPAALAAFDGVRRMNLGLVRSLSAADRATTVKHPEYGVLTADNLIVQLTGHAIHHLKQLQSAVGR
jgi:uncharacterized damage-inducible protein DinB